MREEDERDTRDGWADTADKEAQLAEIMRLVADYGAEYDPSFGHEDTFTRDAYAAVEAAVRKALGL